MIISKTPFRISFCGGGSDIPAFYQKYGGCVLSTSINYYMHVAVHPYFYGNKILLKYSENELVDCTKNIRHSIFRQVLTDMKLSGLEITSMADIPAGTGLGSSSSFTVSLLNALYCYRGIRATKEQLAAEACEIEIQKLGNPIGKQDQYSAAYGGLNFIRFHPDDTVSVQALDISEKVYEQLQKNLLMFYTGDIRSASSILQEQKKNMNRAQNMDNLKRMCCLAENMRDALEQGELDTFGEILNENWELKKSLATGISSGYIDELYQTAIQNGALGGKLLGAGGGGFLLFYCEEEQQQRLREVMKLRELAVKFEREGSSIIFVSDPTPHD